MAPPGARGDIARDMVIPSSTPKAAMPPTQASVVPSRAPLPVTAAGVSAFLPARRPALASVSSVSSSRMTLAASASSWPLSWT